MKGGFGEHATHIIDITANFDEFVRLRKEKKSLKAQLLEIAMGSGSGKLKNSSSANVFL